MALQDNKRKRVFINEQCESDDPIEDENFLIGTKKQKTVHELIDLIKNHVMACENIVIGIENPSTDYVVDDEFKKKLEARFDSSNYVTLHLIQQYMDDLLKKNITHKRLVLNNGRNTLVNLVTSFASQERDKEKQFIDLVVHGCINWNEKPTLEGWKLKNIGKSFAIDHFIDKKLEQGYSDFQIKISDCTYDEEFKIWNGGDKLLIRCTNINFNPYSDTDV